MLTLTATLAIVFGALIIWLWPSKAGESDPFVTIFKTGDPGQVAFIKSLFENAEIPYMVAGDKVQDLFGLGRLGSGYNMITGPVLIKVRESYRREAEELLSEIEESLGHS